MNLKLEFAQARMPIRVVITRVKGDAWEIFVEGYLATQPQFNVGTHREKSAVPQSWLNRLRITRRDIGIDGIFETGDGRLGAQQSKFRSMVIEHASPRVLTDWIPEHSTQMCGFASPTPAPMTIRRSATSYGKVESIGLAETP